MRRAFSVPGFRTLFAATAVSVFGDSVMLLVFSMWVKDLTGSDARAGLTFFWMALPSLVAPLLGGPIDRVRRKPLLVWGSLASAGMLVPLLWVRDATDVWIIWAVATGYGLSFIVLQAGLAGMLKQLLTADLLVDANSAMQTVREAFGLIGPIIGAGLYAVGGGGLVALVDIGSFIAAAVLTGAVAVHQARPSPSAATGRVELGAGLRHLARDTVLRRMAIAVAGMLLVLGFGESAVYAVIDAYGQPVEFLGVIVAVMGVGAVSGALTSSRVIRRVSETRAIVIGLMLMALGLIGVAVVPSMVGSLLAAVPLGYGLLLVEVAYTTLIQVRTPQEIMGRVSTTFSLVLGVPQAASVALGAALVLVLDHRVIFAIMAAAIAAASVYLARASSGDAPPAPGHDPQASV